MIAVRCRRATATTALAGSVTPSPNVLAGTGYRAAVTSTRTGGPG